MANLIVGLFASAVVYVCVDFLLESNLSDLVSGGLMVLGIAAVFVAVYCFCGIFKSPRPQRKQIKENKF